MKILGWISFILLAGATAAMAGAYAWHAGQSHGAEWAWLFAAAVVALVVAECVIAGDRSLAWPLKWAALLSAMAAIASLELGFAASVFSDARAIRGQDEAATRAAQVHREPAAAIRARLEAHEGRHRGIKASWCGSEKLEPRQACEVWTDLRSALAVSEAAERNPAPIARPTGDADARAALLNRMVGGAPAWWADVLVVVLSLALSLGRVALASLLSAPGAAPVAAMVRHVEQFTPAAVVDVAPVKPAAAAVVPAVVDTAPEPVPLRLVTPVAPPADLSEPAGRVLRVVASLATPADGSQGFMGFVPPGVLSQRALAEQAGVSRRHAADGLEALQSAGLLKVEAHGRDGTGYTLLTPK